MLRPCRNCEDPLCGIAVALGVGPFCDSYEPQPPENSEVPPTRLPARFGERVVAGVPHSSGSAQQQHSSSSRAAAGVTRIRVRPDLKWRVIALTEQIELHAALNADLGVAYHYHEVALRVAEARGEEVRTRFEIKEERRKLLLANDARHKQLGGKDLPFQPRWVTQHWQ